MKLEKGQHSALAVTAFIVALKEVPMEFVMFARLVETLLQVFLNFPSAFELFAGSAFCFFSSSSVLTMVSAKLTPSSYLVGGLPRLGEFAWSLNYHPFLIS